MACRGKVGCGGGPLTLFFPPHIRKAAMLEEGVSDHGHERVTVKALPGPSLEVVEAEFLLQLLMGLLASHDPFVADRSAKVRF